MSHKDLARHYYRRFLDTRSGLRTPGRARSQTDRETFLRKRDLRFKIVPVYNYRMKIKPYKSRLVRRLLRPGMTFIDVGVGYYSVLAARAVRPTERTSQSPGLLEARSL